MLRITGPHLKVGRTLLHWVSVRLYPAWLIVRPRSRTAWASREVGYSPLWSCVSWLELSVSTWETGGFQIPTYPLFSLKLGCNIRRHSELPYSWQTSVLLWCHLRGGRWVTLLGMYWYTNGGEQRSLHIALSWKLDTQPLFGYWYKAVDGCLSADTES